MSDNLIALQNRFLGRGTTVYDKLAVIHEAKGCVEDSDIEALAAQFNLPLAHVRATAKFCEETGHSVTARHVVKVCNGEACRAAPTGGCDALVRRLSVALNVGVSETSAEGTRLEHVACLGYCGLGPNVMVNGLPVSMGSRDAEARLVGHLRDGSDLELGEPRNAVHLPAGDAPCILLRHFGGDVVALADARRLPPPIAPSFRPRFPWRLPRPVASLNDATPGSPVSSPSPHLRILAPPQPQLYLDFRYTEGGWTSCLFRSRQGAAHVEGSVSPCMKARTAPTKQSGAANRSR